MPGVTFGRGGPIGNPLFCSRLQPEGRKTGISARIRVIQRRVRPSYKQFGAGCAGEQSAPPGDNNPMCAKRIALAATILSASLSLFLHGCVKRTQTITVHADGGVDLVFEEEGDRKDMESGAPPMAARPGWQFDEQAEPHSDKDDEVRRTARITLPAGSPLPEVYPNNDSAGEALGVHHPAAVTVERRREGVYYHFRQVFKPISWAYLNYCTESILEPVMQKLEDQDVNNLPHDDKVKLVSALVETDLCKRLAGARRAVRAVHPPLTDDEWLMVRETITKVLQGIPTETVLAALEANESAEKENGSTPDALAELTRAVNRDVAEAVRRTLAEFNFPPDRMNAVLAALDEQARRAAIAEDYADESWEVRVLLPGRVLRHNAATLDGEYLTWKIDAEGIHDREVELLATSVVHSGE